MHLRSRQLEAFAAVIRSGTVTRAAQMLHLSQPAVSRLIGDLEHRVGFALFNRDKGRLQPTPEGLALYDEIERSFVGIGKITATAREIRDFRRGSLIIAGLPAMALGYLPQVICAYHLRHPDITVSLQVRSSHKVVEWVASQQVDLGLSSIRVEDPAVRCELLLRTRLVCVVPATHRLASRAEIHPEDLAGEPFVSLGPEQDVRRRVDTVFADAGVERLMRLDSQVSAGCCEFVAAGAGVSIVDPVSVQSYAGRGLVAVAFAPAIPFEFHLLYPAHRPPSRITESFVAALERAVALDLPSYSQPDP